jgi:hypothetical protein
MAEMDHPDIPPRFWAALRISCSGEKTKPRRARRRVERVALKHVGPGEVMHLQPLRATLPTSKTPALGKSDRQEEMGTW